MAIPGPHFRRRRGGVEWRLSEPEVALVTDLREQLATWLTATVDDETDAVRRRLFPTAVLDDEDVDAEVRALFHDDLLVQRLTALDALQELLDQGRSTRDGGVRVTLDDAGCTTVLGVLNDVRLAIGARIDVEAVEREDVRADSPVASALGVMDLLGWMQEQLLEVLQGPLDIDLNGPDAPRGP